ncbi:MAG TPA: sugar phosphate isomerase/epimerase [Steroidobacteraceae bacterium]|nr:sugar phosphate isomerase/epimerase [Steroidobacteraceae bacterium]
MHKASEPQARRPVSPRPATRDPLGSSADAAQFSLAHLTLLRCPPPELTEIAARVGYEYVSYRLIPFGLGGEPRYPVASDRSLLRRTRAALRATGVRLLDIELARIHADVDVRVYLPSFECAAELGARHVLASVWCSDMAFARDRFAELCELAAPLGLTIDLEFVSYAAVATLTQAVQMLRACPFPNAGLCVDTLHFDRAGTAQAELDGLPASWFHYAQICDAPAHRPGDDEYAREIAREGRLFTGHGAIDVRGILSRMPPMPYSIELPNTRLLSQLGPEEFARCCLLSARRYLADGTHYGTNA